MWNWEMESQGYWLKYICTKYISPSLLLTVLRKGAANSVKSLLGEEIVSEEKLSAVFL